MRLHHGSGLWGIVFVLTLSGCSKVDYTNEKEISKTEPFNIEIDAPKSSQTVKVTINASEPVMACVVLSKEAKAVEEFLDRNKMPKEALGSMDGSAEGTFEAKIPSGENYRVLVIPKGNKKTKVTVSVKG